MQMKKSAFNEKMHVPIAFMDEITKEEVKIS